MKKQIRIHLLDYKKWKILKHGFEKFKMIVFVMISIKCSIFPENQLDCLSTI